MKKLSIFIVCICMLLSSASWVKGNAERSVLTNESNQSSDATGDIRGNADSVTEKDTITIEENASMTTEGDSSLVKTTHECSDGESINYWLYTPDNSGTKMPLIVYLHGGTSKGANLDLLMQHEGFPQYIQQKKLSVPAYIIMPQATDDIRAWDEMNDEIIDLVLYVIEAYDIDIENISLTGHSMGGIGTWLIGYNNPEIFSRIAPLSGTVSRRLKDHVNEIKMPVWSFVGTEQSDSNAYNSNVEFFSHLEKYNAETQLTILQGYGHREVVAAYLEYDVVGWLIGIKGEIRLQIGNPMMTVSGKKQEIYPGENAVPVIIDNRTLVPIRAIIEAMGGNVAWDNDKQEATLTYNEDVIKLTINSTKAYLNDTEGLLDVAPVIIDNRTMLPIRYIAEGFNFRVKWIEETQTVTINPPVGTDGFAFEKKNSPH